MKVHILFSSIVGFLAGALCLSAADADIELAGLLVDGEEVSFALKKKSTGTSAWVKVGQPFDGYVVSRFDAAANTLLVTKDGVAYELTLITPKIQASTSALPPEKKSQVVRNLRMLSAAADQFYLENGVGRTSYADLVGPEPEKYIKEIVAVAGEDYRSLEFVQGRPLIVQTSQGQKISFEP